ncbi:Ger(x)C family spore germination protein [Anaerobranca gottschalkii]|uniref:Germination protein, Ger(X)C family n=1 Tax=Anaerobranca gottschalkii DSM 13577 TaxID=1120990 RepID=A0A1I0AKS3_9FIRM|nr:Ger(x)C family spore germination protein [Anaerobranca gottschalkii]SES94955.1 germination protein, Ger(x)C family [Anaerobranca gottschalkii DSM 13577]
MKLNKILVMVTVFLLLIGCGTAQQRVLDDLEIIFGLGLEQGEKEGVLKFTTFGVTQEETAKEPVVQHNVEGYGFKSFIRNWQYQGHKTLALGKVQVIVFGKEIANSGLEKVILELLELPEIDVNTVVAYYDGDPKDIFSLDVIEEQRVAIYLRKLLEKNSIKNSIPRVDLHTLVTDHFTIGKTSYLPILKESKDKSKAIVAGLALLDDEGKVKVTLNDTETLYLLLLKGHRVSLLIDSNVLIKEGKKARVLFEVTGSNVRFDTKLVKGKPQINVRIDCKGTLRNIDGLQGDYFDEEVFDKINREISKHLTVKMQELIDKLQENGVDPVGFGELVRVRHNKYFQKNTWEKDYPQITITNETKIKILRATNLRKKP